MYCDYWNLTKPPFDNVPDASMYVDCHESMENVISETIFAIKEGNECFAVIVGEVGLGKTLSLRVIIDSLEPEKYKVALITNPALSFAQLLREIIGQITGKQCLEKKKVDLLEMFNRLLFETADQGKKIVIVIDEANVLSPSNLDDLRLLTNMQDDDRNLFTLLLVGQMELAKTLENPKRANLFQRIGTYGHLEKLPSPDSVKAYIDSRLRIAGAERQIFENNAIPVIWEFSEHGTPRLINKLCKLCMKAGETNEFATISGEVASQIADRFQKLSKTSKASKRPEIDHAEKESETEKPQRIPRTAAPKEEIPRVKAPAASTAFQREEARPVPPPQAAAPEKPAFRPGLQREDARPAAPQSAAPERPALRPIHPPREEARPVPPERPSFRPVHPSREEFKPAEPPMAPPERPLRPSPPIWEESGKPAPAIPERPSLRPVLQREEARPIEPPTAPPERPPLRPSAPAWEESGKPAPAMPERPSLRPALQREEAQPIEQPMAPPERPPLRPSAPAWEEARPATPERPSLRPVLQREEARSAEPPIPPGRPPLRPVPPSWEESRPAEPQVTPEAPSFRTASLRMEERRPVETEMPPQAPPRPSPFQADEAGTIADERPVRPAAYQREEATPVSPRTVPLGRPSAEYIPSQGVVPPRAAASVPPVGETEPISEEPPVQAENEDYEDVLIGQQTVKLAIPGQVIKQAQGSSNDNKHKLAGYWAAQILKGNPSLTHSSLTDPVSVWFDVKNVILKKFNSSSR